MAIPTYDELDCKKSGPCCDLQPGHCADCGGKIPTPEDAVTKDERVAYYRTKGLGFQSQTSNHNHHKMTKGIAGISPVRRELCLFCYRKDFREKYPDAQLPL